MPTDSFTLYILSGILAFIPALIWLTIIFKKTKRKGIQTLLFLGSIFSVVPIFGIQYLIERYPQFDTINILTANLSNGNLKLIIHYLISVAVLEEIIKQILIRVIDRKYLLIQTINESLQFSLITALGFAFAENIYYFYNIYLNYGSAQLFVAVIFRSTFTTCAHLIFSGFLGYYYGIAKFSLNIVEKDKWIGKKQYVRNFISKTFGISRTESFKELTILKGIAIASVLHAAYDYFLEKNKTLPVVIFELIFAALLVFLLKRKSGKLILVTDVDAQRSSTMATKDEEVVIQLLGMWFQDKRYVDVIHICQRLLQRDPDNKVVQLFKANAMDKVEVEDTYGKILKNIFPSSKTPKQKTLEDLAKDKILEKTYTTSGTVPPSPSTSNVNMPPISQIQTTEQKPPEEQVFKLKI